MKEITRAELRVLVEGEIYKNHRNKTHKQLAKVFNISLHQVSGYLSHSHVAEEAIQKLGEYFGKAVDTSELKKTNKTIYFEKSRNDSEARKKQADKSDMEYVLKRRAVEEHQAKIRARDLEALA